MPEDQAARENKEGRAIDESGQFVETVTPADVLDAVREVEDPVVTAKELGEHLGVSSESARRKLHTLADEGRVDRKEVGARAVVWWAVDDQDGGRESDA